MAMGGFNGTDPAITLTQFKKLVKNGELKYFYYSGKSGNTAIINWIKKHATKVKSSLYQSSSSTASASGMGQKPTASTGKQKPSGNGAKPTPGMQKPSGKGAKLTPGKQNSKMKSGTKSSTKSTKKQTTMQLPGGMGGMGASGVLYDLSSIYK